LAEIQDWVVVMTMVVVEKFDPNAGDEVADEDEAVMAT